MARVTIEDCLEKIPNRYKMIIAAMKRVKQLVKGKPPAIDPRGSKPTVIALREIAEGKIKIIEPQEESEDYYS